MLDPKRPVMIPVDMPRALDLPGRPRRWNNDFDRIASPCLMRREGHVCR